MVISIMLGFFFIGHYFPWKHLKMSQIKKDAYSAFRESIFSCTSSESKCQENLPKDSEKNVFIIWKWECCCTKTSPK